MRGSTGGIERPNHLVDACIANGQTHEDVSHTLSGSTGNYLQLGWILAVLFPSPAIPLILLLIKQTCSQKSLPTDSLLFLEDETPCPTTSNISLYTAPTRLLALCLILKLGKDLMVDGCPSPFLRRPSVFTFAHLYYLPHLHYPATYIGTTQIRIFAPVQ
jgi:hypothetical protein